MDMKSAVALVSGGASGLGEATVRVLMEAGARVVIADMNAERGNALAKELGANAAFIKADVGNPDQVQAAVDRAVSMGPLRAVISCAGIGTPARIVDRDGIPHDFAAFQKVIAVNLGGTFNMTRLGAAC